MAMNIEEVRGVLNSARRQLMKKANVVATGIGYKITNGRQTDDICIICSVGSKATVSALGVNDRVPPSVDGILTDVFTTGPLTVFQNHKERKRPAPGGVSIGHYAITAGTFGCVVRRDGMRMVLSNNHVLANSNQADIGDDILQPGPTDGGARPADVIASLYDFIPIVFDGETPPPGNGSTCSLANGAAAVLNSLSSAAGRKSRLMAVYADEQDVSTAAQATGNKVDCAIAKPISDNDILDDILEIGPIEGVADGTLGLAIKKSGRTTGLTNGTIQQIDVTSVVNYGSGKNATFTDQIMAGNISAGGDSGSAILNEQNEIVGLLFAGSSNTTIINRIQNVFELLNVGL